jgi:hypothetical protein
LGEPYDFLSIMHYSNNTFARNDQQPTIKIRDKYKTEATKLMGQRYNLSKSDVSQTNKLYHCTSLSNYLQDIYYSSFLFYYLFKAV